MKNRYSFIEQYPQPTNPIEALAHTLAVLEGEGDDTQVVTATSGVYGPGVRTGLTMGDLREIAGTLKRWAGSDA